MGKHVRVKMKENVKCAVHCRLGVRVCLCSYFTEKALSYIKWPFSIADHAHAALVLHFRFHLFASRPVLSLLCNCNMHIFNDWILLYHLFNSVLFFIRQAKRKAFALNICTTYIVRIIVQCIIRPTSFIIQSVIHSLTHSLNWIRNIYVLFMMCVILCICFEFDLLHSELNSLDRASTQVTRQPPMSGIKQTDTVLFFFAFWKVR